MAGAADLVPTLILLLDGAMDAAAAVGNGLFVLLTHHHQLARLATNPTHLAGAVDELLRYEPPFTTLAPRRSTRSFPLTDGTTIPAGELTIVSVAAANRDPVRFPDPDRFDIARNAKSHLAFGHGPHQCTGMQLGRAAVEVALRAFLEQYPNSRLARPPDESTWHVGTYIRRLATLPVVLGCSDEHKQVS
jgi:cytochrome P450 PksS